MGEPTEAEKQASTAYLAARSVGGGLFDYYCRACGGYAGPSSFAEHQPIDCIIELRTRVDVLESRS